MMMMTCIYSHLSMHILTAAVTTTTTHSCGTVGQMIVLRQSGSVADIVAMFQLSKKSNDTTLPDHEVRLLEAVGVKIRYLAKEESDAEDFYEAMFHKFEILSLTEYRRVLFLDGDVMPMGNLDYLFHLSDEGEHGQELGLQNQSVLFKENVIIAGDEEPANGGFFLLTPGTERMEELWSIVDRVRAYNRNGSICFDEVKGWGHIIEPPDKWHGRYDEGRNWSFYGVESDQGLLYYYVKYFRQNVTIIGSPDQGIENWGSKDGKAWLETTLKFNEVFPRYARPIRQDGIACDSWLCDYFHFGADTKPWLQKPDEVPGLISYIASPPVPLSKMAADVDRLRSALALWWFTLQDLNMELSMGLNMINWTVLPGPPLGMWTVRKC